MKLPQWQCHRTVRAARVVKVALDCFAGPALFLEGQHDPLPISREWALWHQPAPGGYFVQQENGRVSFMSAAEFEADHAPILTEADALADLDGTPRPDHPCGKI